MQYQNSSNYLTTLLLDGATGTNKLQATNKIIKIKYELLEF